MMISEFCAFSFLYRKYVLNESANLDVTTTRDAPSSPEFLPPDAKVQKLAIKDKTGSAKTRGCEELESYWLHSSQTWQEVGIKSNKTKQKKKNVSQKFGKGENALFLTLYALTSVKVFSILFSIYSLMC